MTLGKKELCDSARESVSLMGERAYIRKQAEISYSGRYILGPNKYKTSCKDIGKNEGKQDSSWCLNSEMDSDKTICLSPDDYENDKSQENVEHAHANCNKINSVSKNELIRKLNLPLNIQTLFEGFAVGLPDDVNVPVDNKPPWLDLKKFKIGQRFGQDNYCGVCYADLLILLFTFSVPDGLQPMIFTGKSGTPFTAFRRYLSTVLRVQSWVDDDIWSKESLGYKNLTTVRAIHLSVSKRMNSIPYSELKKHLTVRGPTKDKAVWSTLKNTLSEDFRSACPFLMFQNSSEDRRLGEVYLSQAAMSLTQFAFISFIIVYPEYFGAAGATDEELEGHIHFWRGVGYLLGIEDKYNFCDGNLKEVREKCVYIIEKVIKPYFVTVTEDWEHMCRCMFAGAGYFIPGLNFEVSLLYLCWILDIPVPKTSATISWAQYFCFQLTKAMFFVNMRLPGVKALQNWLLRKSLKRASSWTTETLDSLKRKSYDYEKEMRFCS